jgi:LytR cell envelope-related transcriptional attenuator
MEHSLSPLELGRPWRTTALVASALALLELLAIVALGIALLGEPVADRVRARAEGPAFPKPAKPAPVQRTRETHLPTLARADTSILVLNGNGRTGAAGEAAARVSGAGYIVAGTANAPSSSYRRSVVMYRKGRSVEAKRLARDLRIPVVGPLDGLRASELMGAHLVLIVGG